MLRWLNGDMRIIILIQQRELFFKIRTKERRTGVREDARTLVPTRTHVRSDWRSWTSDHLVRFEIPGRPAVLRRLRPATRAAPKATNLFAITVGLTPNMLASNLAVFSFMTPLFGVTFGVLVLDEPLSFNFVVGAILVLFGITFVSAEQWLRRRLRTLLGH